MKKILVPTDFSDQAFNAIKAAASIAKDSSTEIILLHIIDLPQETMDMIKPGYEIPEIMLFKQAAEQRILELAKDPILENLTVSVVLRLGKTFNEVNLVAAENNVDMIVMGSHGASGFKEVFIGSNTEKVVRSSEIPVLVIKGESTNVSFNNVVFASDFMEKNPQAYNKILNFLKEKQAKPHFLMVNTPNSFKPTHEAERIIEDFLKDLDIEDYHFSVYSDFEIEKGIANYADRINADLIVMGTHGRKGLARFINGSISEDIVNHSNRNIITFKM
jgi:nucleotide-binding universal stress UspA family protein